MSNPDIKLQSKVTIHIGRAPPTPAQKTAWGKFWARLIHEALEETPENADSMTGALKGDKPKNAP